VVSAPWVRAAFLVTLWGTSFPAIKLALRYAPPLLLAGAAMLATGLVLTTWLILRQGLAPLRGKWSVVLVSALFNVILTLGLNTLAISYLSAGVGAILLYMQPIFVALLAHRWLGEPLSSGKIAGLALAFVGVLMLSIPQTHTRLPLFGVILGAASGLGWAIGTVYVKRAWRGPSVAPLVAAQFLVGGAVVTGSVLAIERASAIHWSVVLIVCFGYLVLSLAIGWVLWLDLVTKGHASQVSAYIFCVPLVSIVGGAALLREGLSGSVALGASAIVVGIYLATRRMSALASGSKYRKGSQTM
jgi:drug/metabolite transporter (DMT)-like permease